MPPAGEVGGPRPRGPRPRGRPPTAAGLLAGLPAAGLLLLLLLGAGGPRGAAGDLVRLDRDWQRARRGAAGAAGGGAPAAEAPPDPRAFLSSKTPYAFAAGGGGGGDPPLPEGCAEAYVHQLVRHGTRWPTAGRMAQADALEGLLRRAAPADPGLAALVAGWTSPFKAAGGLGDLGGALHGRGEQEMWELGERTRQRHEGLFEGGYRPARFLVSATTAPRASASAVAFGMGAFVPDQAGVGEGYCRLQPFALDADRGVDRLLRFFDFCPAYSLRWVSEAPWSTVPHRGLTPRLRLLLPAGSKRAAQARVERWAERELAPVAARLARRLGLPEDGEALGRDRVAALWSVCQHEAATRPSLEGSLCGLFAEEVRRRSCSGAVPPSAPWTRERRLTAGPQLQDMRALERVTDVELLETKGHGGDASGVNVGMAGPLLEHVVGALGAAAQGAVERAWFLFAHAETLLPLQALLGLHGAVSSRGCGRGRGGG